MAPIVQPGISAAAGFLSAVSADSGAAGTAERRGSFLWGVRVSVEIRTDFAFSFESETLRARTRIACREIAGRYPGCLHAIVAVAAKKDFCDLPESAARRLTLVR